MKTDLKINADFSATLNKRYENARRDMRRMNEIKAELDFNKMLQKELTQENKNENEIETDDEKNFH